MRRSGVGFGWGSARCSCCCCCCSSSSCRCSSVISGVEWFEEIGGDGGAFYRGAAVGHVTRRRLGSTGAAAAGAVVGICGLIVETSSVFVAGFVTARSRNRQLPLDSHRAPRLLVLRTTWQKDAAIIRENFRRQILLLLFRFHPKFQE